MESVIWNPWHGCTKYSEGCQNCYVYRRDEAVGRDASEVYRTKSFRLVLQKKRDGQYKIPPHTQVYLCMTSDFLLDAADAWRNEIWDMIRERKDLRFTIITKRIERFTECVPHDWGEGWDHVSIACTIENQRQCDIRLPVFLAAPIQHKSIICEPLLGAIDVGKYLISEIESLICGGESGPHARICDYDWVLRLRDQCIEKNIRFSFKQTGANFRKEGRVYHVPRKYQHIQAKKANIDC